jgi:hypothetical protein
MQSRIIQKSGIALWCIALSYAIYLMYQLSVPYTAMERNIDFLQTKQRVYHIDYWRISFYAHVFTSIFVLPAGFTQFNKAFFRKRYHRWLGMVYVATVLLIGAPTGFMMALHANGGLGAKASFVLLSLLWFTTTLLALIQVKKKNFEDHGEWMVYSYALALSAITFRLLALAFDLLKVEARPQEVYVAIAWLSWVPNLVIAEILIRTGFVRRLFTRKGL